ncbi:hypothetical protein CEH05_04930 [Halobacillus halophilus]|uniref:MobA-like NTP transferase domain-containing protein n=1 Tax=Halobacillus halophilus (strain ATCC 35676 / DSM 2266 / JCM 20832 / KCTC 3685 / LMG 17431 / NBRC 102448 / NCIMB 2269) TaxID=866895 RepID=I0JJM5_HALH3|nr:NTP transferase domain-containing protein [Halobacillus halophilus]ASF38497.1 hypothetical protein CEH05_04930 [Halobacillus halophilus]CCG44343.1 conserved hypothetical protein [Halobacillus halophilus DSM 2266]
MKIVIPMSGRGSRFLDAGYTHPKPLIEVDGFPMIEQVVNMFPGESDFIFICSNDHLESTNMEEILVRIAPKGKIVGIDPHKKGPVYAVSRAFDYINDDDEVIVNYCDFSCYWNYVEFLKDVRSSHSDGAIAAYKGFHPHMLGTTNYAFMREENQWMLEIKEKEPFTNNRMNEYASSGTYYFKTGSMVKKYFEELMNKGIDLKGEYYVSLVYNLMKSDGLKIRIFEIDHMLQWGTPQDLEEYLQWSHYFKEIINRGNSKDLLYDMTTMIPLSGRGKRFSEKGYRLPKPLISVSGKPMVLQSHDHLPQSAHQIFICLEEHLNQYHLEEEIKRSYPKADIMRLSQVTEGQAVTCEWALEQLDLERPLLISACDNGVLWNEEKFQDMLLDESVDAIIWSFRNHPSSNAHPEMYGWANTNTNSEVTSVSVKKPISHNPENDHAIVGTFYFRKARDYKESVKRIKAKNIRVNGEFYVDSSINELIAMNLKVKVFEVDHYICWGTPNDLRTFEYWQSFFHKWKWHPYHLDKDIFMAPEKINKLDEKYRCPKPVLQ